MQNKKYMYSILIFTALLGASPSQAELITLVSGVVSQAAMAGLAGIADFSSAGPTGSAACNAPGTTGLVAAKVVGGQLRSK